MRSRCDAAARFSRQSPRARRTPSIRWWARAACGSRGTGNSDAPTWRNCPPRCRSPRRPAASRAGLSRFRRTAACRVKAWVRSRQDNFCAQPRSPRAISRPPVSGRPARPRIADSPNSPTPRPGRPGRVPRRPHARESASAWAPARRRAYTHWWSFPRDARRLP